MSSTVPAVLTAISNVLTAGNVPNVYIGPARPQPGDFTCIAWAGPDNPAAVATYQYVNAAAGVGESYEVDVQFVAWDGNYDAASCFVRVYGYLDVLIAALSADKTLGGECMAAVVSSSQLRPDVLETGTQVILTGTVAVRADRA